MLYSVISPAKKLAAKVDYAGQTSDITFATETASLVKLLKAMSPDKLAGLMHLSDKLAHLNYLRYQEFAAKKYTESNSAPAVLLFQGDVYQGMQAESFTKTEMAFCEKTLSILSGLYGVLSPLDLIQPYRLEMGTSLENSAGKNLYAFWKEKVTAEINRRMKQQKASCLINLASDEYFSVIDKAELDKPIIKVDFKENKEGKLKTIGICAKRARGAMVNYMVKNRCKTLDSLMEFDSLGYQFNEALSAETNLVFIR